MDFLEWLKSMLQQPPEKPLTTEQKVNSAYGRYDFDKKKKIPRTAADVGVPSWLDSLYKSPFADSLYQTSNVPRGLGVVPQGEPSSTVGVYQNLPDFVGIKPSKSELYTPRETLAHEMGHKYVPTKRDVSLNAAFTPLDKSNEKLDPYYATDPSEGYAQAFKNAFNFLAETARDPKMDYRKFAGDLEGNTPGMGMIIQDLMKLPIFAKHPLQGQIFTEAKKK
jgi:hypothetical protein